MVCTSGVEVPIQRLLPLVALAVFFLLLVCCFLYCGDPFGIPVAVLFFL